VYMYMMRKAAYPWGIPLHPRSGHFLLYRVGPDCDVLLLVLCLLLRSWYIPVFTISQFSFLQKSRNPTAA
jgi:hypothetical protein